MSIQISSVYLTPESRRAVIRRGGKDPRVHHLSEQLWYALREALTLLVAKKVFDWQPGRVNKHHRSYFRVTPQKEGAND